MNRPTEQIKRNPASAALRFLMTCRIGISLGLLWPGVPALGAELRQPIADGHWDVGADIQWVDVENPELGGDWEFFLYDYAANKRLFLNEYVFVVDRRYKGTIPSGGSWGQVLGTAAADRWTLPYTQHPQQIFLGFRVFAQPAQSLEGNNPADTNGVVTLRLEQVTGSGRSHGGNFAAYEIFGLATSPDPNSNLFSTLLPDRSLKLPVRASAATHTHYYWDMTTPGRYEVVISLNAKLRATGAPVVGSGRIVFKVIGDSVGPPSGFGELNLDGFPWIYHAQLGWLYWAGYGAEEGWFFDTDARSYYWIHSEGHTWIYDSQGTGDWMYLR